MAERGTLKLAVSIWGDGSCRPSLQSPLRFGVVSAAVIAHEALGLLEIDGIARALRAQDAALKRATIDVVACAPVSPGKVILILGGALAEVEEALEAADEVVGSAQLDRLFLSGVHEGVWPALTGDTAKRRAEALAICELTTAASALKAADRALKTSPVTV